MHPVELAVSQLTAAQRAAVEKGFKTGWGERDWRERFGIESEECTVEQLYNREIIHALVQQRDGSMAMIYDGGAQGFDRLGRPHHLDAEALVMWLES